MAGGSQPRASVGAGRALKSLPTQLFYNFLTDILLLSNCQHFGHNYLVLVLWERGSVLFFFNYVF